MARRSLIALYFFGLFLVLTSAHQMVALAHIGASEFNRNNFGYMPQWMFMLRLTFSWSLRVVGICAGVQILRNKNSGRILGIMIGIFTILAGPWKYPFESFIRQGEQMDAIARPLLDGTTFQDVSFSLPVVARSASLVSWGLDILFWGIFIYYFTRPLVKAHFLPPSSSAAGREGARPLRRRK